MKWVLDEETISRRLSEYKNIQVDRIRQRPDLLNSCVDLIYFTLVLTRKESQVKSSTLFLSRTERIEKFSRSPCCHQT